MWRISYATHKYLIEALSGQHAMSMLISRYVKFIQSMKKSPKIAVQFLVQKVANNCNTLTGRNVRFVCDKIGVENIFDIGRDFVHSSYVLGTHIFMQHTKPHLNIFYHLVLL